MTTETRITETTEKTRLTRVDIPPLALQRLREVTAAVQAAQAAAQDQAGIVAMALGIDPRAIDQSTERLRVDIETGTIIIELIEGSG